MEVMLPSDINDCRTPASADPVHDFPNWSALSNPSPHSPLDLGTIHVAMSLITTSGLRCNAGNSSESCPTAGFAAAECPKGPCNYNIPKGSNVVPFWLGPIFLLGIIIYYPKRNYFEALGYGVFIVTIWYVPGPYRVPVSPL